MTRKFLIHTAILSFVFSCSVTVIHAQIMQDYAELFFLSDNQKRREDSVLYHWTIPEIIVKIDTTGKPPSISFFEFIAVVQNAVDQWSARWPSRLAVTYGGLTPPNTGADTADHICTIFWGDSVRFQDDPIEYIGENVWGAALYHFHVPSSAMIDGDICLNPNVKLNAAGTAIGVWSTVKTSMNGGVADTADLEGIIVHELGHILGHDHGLLSPLPAVSPSTMADINQYFLNWKLDSLKALCMRTINFDDWRGICYLYGDTLRVPNVFYTIEEAFDFLQPGQNIVFGKGLHRTPFYNVDTLSTKRVLGASSALYMMDSTKLVIADTLIVERGAKLVLKSDRAAHATASIEFLPGGVLIIEDSAGLQGVGHITNPNILWQCDFHLPENDSLAFIAKTGDCSYEFTPGAGMAVDGSVSFFSEASSLSHRFVNCEKGIQLQRNGALFEARERVRFENIPQIRAHAATRIVSIGAAGSDSVVWSFADAAGIVNYGTLVAEHSVFTGQSNGWAGIVSAGDSSYLSLNGCIISHILAESNGNKYSAVSLIGTGNSTLNLIKNCDILRVQSGKHNAGIFLYPSYSSRGGAIGSYLLVDSTNIRSNWEYGVMNVSGGVQIENSSITGNMGGIFTYSGTTYLRRNCITGHDVYGLYGQNFATFTLTSDPIASGSFNTIADNGSQPFHANIRLKDRATLDGGWFDGTTLCRAKNILRQSSAARQIIMSNRSLAFMEGTYWGEAPGNSGAPFGALDAGQMAKMFITDTSSILRISSALVNEPDSTQGCAASAAVRAVVLPAHDRTFDEAGYDTGSEMTEMCAAGDLFVQETNPLRASPDDFQTALPRLASRLADMARSNRSRASRDAAQYFLAKTFALYGDLEGAKRELSELLDGSPSSLIRPALLLRQNIAFALRDTAAIELAYARLHTEDRYSHETAIAATARQVFYRLDGCPAPRRTLHVTGIREAHLQAYLPAGIRLEQNTPNPFNPSTEITYGIPHETHLKLAVYDNLGRQVEVLANGWKSAGTYTVTFEAKERPSGIYFYRIETAQGVVTKKMALVK